MCREKWFRCAIKIESGRGGVTSIFKFIENFMNSDFFLRLSVETWTVPSVWPFRWRHWWSLCIFSAAALVASDQTLLKLAANPKFQFLNPNYRHLPNTLFRVRITGDHSIYSTSFLYQIPSQQLKLFSLLKAFMLNTSTVRRLIRNTQKDICCC